jgi:hypothetical protein
MAQYSVYLLDDLGRIAGRVDADYGDDNEARASAQRDSAPGATVEIWCGTRRVGQVCGASRVGHHVNGLRH